MEEAQLLPGSKPSASGEQQRSVETERGKNQSAKSNQQLTKSVIPLMFM